MRFCFILEEKYVHKPMPMVVADQLQQWGHQIEVLQPYAAVTSLTDLSLTEFDAYVLKTVSDGPGLTILEAAEAVGIPTINNSRAIRLVRDKAVAVAFAQACDLPVPTTYFVGHYRALVNVPRDLYPVVVKPSNGTSMQDIHLVRTYEEMASITLDANSYYLAMRYVENTGYDIKLYVTGQEVHAIVKSSPLHGEVRETEIPVSREMLKLARFYGVPRKVASVAEYILHAAYRNKLNGKKRTARPVISARKSLGRQVSRIVPAELVSNNVSAKRVRMN